MPKRWRGTDGDHQPYGEASAPPRKRDRRRKKSKKDAGSEAFRAGTVSVPGALVVGGFAADVCSDEGGDTKRTSAEKVNFPRPASSLAKSSNSDSGHVRKGRKHRHGATEVKVISKRSEREAAPKSHVPKIDSFRESEATPSGSPRELNSVKLADGLEDQDHIRKSSRPEANRPHSKKRYSLAEEEKHSNPSASEESKSRSKQTQLLPAHSPPDQKYAAGLDPIDGLEQMRVALLHKDIGMMASIIAKYQHHFDFMRNEVGFTPLHLAACFRRSVVAQELIRLGTNVNQESINGETALFYACQCDGADVVEVLLEAGASIDKTMGDGGATPLHVAAQYGSTGAAQLLLEAKANVHLSTNAGETPLHLCSQMGYVTVGDLLLEYGAYVDARTDTGATPLHIAAQQGQELFVEMLLRHGADVDASRKTGTTPLLAAIFNGRKPTVRLLLNAGANISRARCGDLTGVSIARSLGYHDIWLMLSRVDETGYMSDPNGADDADEFEQSKAGVTQSLDAGSPAADAHISDAERAKSDSDSVPYSYSDSEMDANELLERITGRRVKRIRDRVRRTRERIGSTCAECGKHLFPLDKTGHTAKNYCKQTRKFIRGSKIALQILGFRQQLASEAMPKYLRKPLFIQILNCFPSDDKPKAIEDLWCRVGVELESAAL